MPATQARRLRLFNATTVVIGGIIGAGIFLNPAIVAQRAHSITSILSSWTIGGAIALAGATTRNVLTLLKLVALTALIIGDLLAPRATALASTVPSDIAAMPQALPASSASRRSPSSFPVVAGSTLTMSPLRS